LLFKKDKDSVIRFGLYHPSRLTVYEQHVIRRAGLGGIFTHGNTQTRAKIDVLEILDYPAGLFEPLVDL
jgi:hypothetical protein